MYGMYAANGWIWFIYASPTRALSCQQQTHTFNFTSFTCQCPSSNQDYRVLH